LAAADEFCSAAFEGFDHATTCSGAGQIDLQVAGQGVSIRFAGRPLASRLSPAFSHLTTTNSATDPAFTLGCWDRTATGVAPPPPPWNDADYLSAGRIRGHMFGDLRVSYDPWLRFLELYDRRSQRALFHVNGAADVPAWFDRSPFRTLMSWWAADHAMTMLHASCVTTAAGGAVLAGRSGDGKSTTAMVCAMSGLGFVADDCCLVGPDPDPFVQSVYRGSKLEADAVLRLADHLPQARGTESGQYLFDPEPVTTQVPLRVVLVVSVGRAAGPVVTTLTPAQAVRALLPCVLGELGGRGTELLAPLARLVRRVPCLRFELGSDSGQLVAAVVRAIESAQ
jgi:hypothetical protein